MTRVGDETDLEFDPSRVAEAIPGFEIIGRLGKGGMGEVYLARQRTLDRLVAIKFLVPEGTKDSERDLARFRREAELMAKVSHPNILSIFDFGEAHGRPYLIMEYVEGGDLRRRLNPGHPLSFEEIRNVIMPVGEALMHLHAQGIIHRDLKPENILLHDGRHPRVADFGIAILRAGGGELTVTSRGPGTMGYVAPEQHHRLPVDERADQYSLAALTYEMLTGQLPLGVFKPPSLLNPRVGSELDAVLLRALQESAGDRFSTVREFTIAVDRAMSHRRSDAAHPAPGTALRWAAGMALFAAVALAAVPRLTAPSRDREAPSVLPPVGDAEAKPKLAPAPPKAAPKPEPTITDEIKNVVAFQIWQERGSPTGPEGEAMRDANHQDACRLVDAELAVLAEAIWRERGSPSGLAGEAMKESNWYEAERRLYKHVLQKAPPGPR